MSSRSRRRMGIGLVDVDTDRLRALLRAIHRKETPVPVTPHSLTALGLQDWSEALLGHLRGLEERAVRAVLIAVLAERQFAAERDLDPDPNPDPDPDLNEEESDSTPTH